jgi:DNA-binding transcriptional ArsR family regulator
VKPFMVIKDPEAFQLLGDETRRKILYLLRVKEMSVGQIASELGMTSQAIYHHIRKLLKGDMVEVVREERVGHLIESYYRATAEDFLLTHGKVKADTLQDRELAEEQVTAVLNAFKKLGFKLEFDENEISQLIDLRVGLQECCQTGEGEQKMDDIWNMDELNLLTKMMASDFLKMLLMSDEEFNQKQEATKKLRDLLRSLAKK